MMKKSKLFIASLLGTVMVAALTLWGCGSSGTQTYDVPPAPQPAGLVTASKNAVATAADLKAWIDGGYINNSVAKSVSKSVSATTTAQKLVILDVTDPAKYTAGHIPGAQLMNTTEYNQTRLEGLAPMTTQVVDGTIIDPVIKRSGIDANTTIVFTVNKGGSFMNMARAYFTFRYWGFPKERLKILDGGDDTWVDAGYALTTDLPIVTPSTYSVKNNTNNFQMRSAIGDMIALVDNINLGTVKTDATGVSILDERGGSPTVYIANANVDDFAQYSNVISGKTSTYKDKAALTARLATFGVTAQKAMTYVYCASGTRASTTFFVLDGILGWPVNLYDGSWGQWGSYYLNTVTAANNLPATSPWRVDINTPGTNLPRTTGVLTTTGTVAMALDPIASAMYSVTDPRANQIKVTDLLYITPVVTTPTTTTPSGGSAPGGC